jgi:hypothetical protein
VRDAAEGATLGVPVALIVTGGLAPLVDDACDLWEFPTGNVLSVPETLFCRSRSEVAALAHLHMDPIAEILESSGTTGPELF